MRKIKTKKETAKEKIEVEERQAAEINNERRITDFKAFWHSMAEAVHEDYKRLTI